MYSTRRSFIAAAAACSSGVTVSSTWASQPMLDVLKIMSGFPAGTTPDVVARSVGDKLVGRLARAVVVDNRTGAGGQLAAAAVKSAPPDGSNLLLTPMAVMGVYPFTYKKLPYDPVADFTPVSIGAVFDYGVAVGPAVPESVKTIRDLVAWYRANPSKANIASSATGSPLHFVGVMLGRKSGLELTHVGYRGTPPAINDMLGGNMPALCAPLGTFLSLRDPGKLRILASTGRTRSRFTPDVPTLVEEGYKDMVFTEWYSFFAPARTSSSVVERVNAELKRALLSDEVVKAFANFGMESSPSSSDELMASLQENLKTWSPIVKSIGFSADT